MSYKSIDNTELNKHAGYLSAKNEQKSQAKWILYLKPGAV